VSSSCFSCQGSIDDKNIILEIRAGTGGDEAAISPVIFSACIHATPNPRAGKLKSGKFPSSMGVLKKSLPPSRAKKCTPN